MGKMIDAQSIVVASTATNWYGHEGTILRFVFKHSIALACLVGILVMLQAYVYPFTLMVMQIALRNGDRVEIPAVKAPRGFFCAKFFAGEPVQWRRRPIEGRRKVFRGVA